MIQCNTGVCKALSPLQQRGAGYRLPTDSAFRILELREETDAPSSEEMLSAVSHFHDSGAGWGAICFGGGHAEPLSTNFEQTVEAMQQIRTKWHGTPIVVQTNGLFPETHEILCELDREWRQAPGSDGDSKLSVWVNLAASNPREYDKIMKPEGKMGFQKVCGFITQLVESNMTVIATASQVPKVNMNSVQGVAMGLGCTDFFKRTYHPETLYDILGLDSNCTSDEIREAYLSMAKSLHPDVMQEEDGGGAMAGVTEAYGILGDVDLRQRYDEGVADIMLSANEEDFFSSVVNKTI